MASRSLRRVPKLRDVRIGSLPSQLPVFPLAGALLLPAGKLPLNIFEPRYQAMIEDALAADRLIGMIQPIESPEDDPSDPDAMTPLFAVGCVGRITSFSEREDGSSAITLSGLVRFRMLNETTTITPYRTLSVSYDGFAHDMERADEVAFDRAALVGALRRYFRLRGFEARWDAIDQMDDETLLVTLGMICPFPPAEKQALLEAPTLPERARTLRTLLEMAGHGTDDEGQHSA